MYALLFLLLISLLTLNYSPIKYRYCQQSMLHSSELVNRDEKENMAAKFKIIY
jgi:hypothetical protein